MYIGKECICLLYGGREWCVALTVSLEMTYCMLFPDLSYDVQPGLDVSVCTNSLRTYIPISAATMHPFATSNNLECQGQAPYLCWATWYILQGLR